MSDFGPHPHTSSTGARSAADGRRLEPTSTRRARLFYLAAALVIAGIVVVAVLID